MFWISHEILLAERPDIDDLVAALMKVAEHSSELTAASGAH
jgi:hypothetical protein